MIKASAFQPNFVGSSLILHMLGDSLDSSMGKPNKWMSRKRRSRPVWERSASAVEEGCKKAKVVTKVEDAQCAECHQNLKTIWKGLCQKILVHLGPKEMGSLCQELELVSSSEGMSSVIFSEGSDTTAPATIEFSFLGDQVEELKARNAEQEKRIVEMTEEAYAASQTAKTKELELESAVRKSIALEKQNADLEREKDKQSKMIEFYGSRMEDLKTRIDELEESLAAASSKSPKADDTWGQEIRNEDSLEDVLSENSKLKKELTRVSCSVELQELQIEMEREKKEEALGELVALQNQKAIYEATKTELLELQKQKHMFDAYETELAQLRGMKSTYEAERYDLLELRRQKETCEAQNAELAELLGLRRTLEAERDDLAELRCQKKIFEQEKIELAELRTLRRNREADRHELAALRCLKKTFEDAEKELKEALYDGLPDHKSLVKAAAEELQTLRKQSETSQAAAEELSALRNLKATYEAGIQGLCSLQDLKATYEAGIQELSTLQKQRASFESAAAELVKLRKQKVVLATVVEEMDKLRKQSSSASVLSDAEKEELELLRGKRTMFRAAQRELATFRGLEDTRTGKERRLIAKVDRLVEKQGKLVNTIKYLEGKRIQDKEEYDRYCSELEDAKVKLHQASVDLKDVEQQLAFAAKANEILHEEKSYVLNEKDALQQEKDRLLKERQDLEWRLHGMSEQNNNLQFQIELVEKEKTRVELDSAALNRELFLKAAKLECLKAELRLKQADDEEDKLSVEKLRHEVKTLKEANRVSSVEARTLREELSAVTNRLQITVSKDLCCVCLHNTRDTVFLPCHHMKSCFQCGKQLLQKGKSCPTCGEEISGFVHCSPVV